MGKGRLTAQEEILPPFGFLLRVFFNGKKHACLIAKKSDSIRLRFLWVCSLDAVEAIPYAIPGHCCVGKELEIGGWIVDVLD